MTTMELTELLRSAEQPAARASGSPAGEGTGRRSLARAAEEVIRQTLRGCALVAALAVVLIVLVLLVILPVQRFTRGDAS